VERPFRKDSAFAKISFASMFTFFPII